MRFPKRSRRRRIAVLSAFFLLSVVIPTSCATTNETKAKRSFGQDRKQPAHRSTVSPPGDGHEVSFSDGKLASYIAYALEKSPELEALFERWQAGVNRIAGERRLPDPVVSYAFYIRNVETRVGPQRHRLSLKQTFPWPTKLSAGADAAAARAEALARRFDAKAIAIAAQVEQKYWAIWGLQTARAIHEEHIAVLEGLSESAAGLLMTGQIELADQQQIDLSTARMKDLVAATDEKILQAEAALKGLIGAPQSAKVTITNTPQSRKVDFDVDRLVEKVRNHPYLASFESLAGAEEAAAKRERASRYPSFALGLDWIETGESDVPDVPDNGKDAVLIGVGISVPLWQSNYKAGIAAKLAESRAFRAEGRAAADSAEAAFHQVVSDLRDAERRAELYRHTLIPQVDSVFESVLGTYVSGKGSIASILLAQKDLLDLRLERVEIETASATGWAALSNLVGTPLSAAAATDRESEGVK